MADKVHFAASMCSDISHICYLFLWKLQQIYKGDKVKRTVHEMLQLEIQRLDSCITSGMEDGIERALVDLKKVFYLKLMKELPADMDFDSPDLMGRGSKIIESLKNSFLSVA